ncbi:MAG: hypothetical protein JNM56_14460 [Planctomycetia bacterium]|nr:hypothetical protein [Planctomycetia bacterium]
MTIRVNKSGLLLLVLLGLAAGCQEPTHRATTPATTSVPPPTDAVRVAPLAGTASCSGRACHGNAEPVPSQPLPLNEFFLWSLRDPHVGAYDVLLNERSRQIARNLRIPDGKAETDARCLACHTNPLAARSDAGPLLQAERRFGVGCEACHGSAARWLTAHTTPAWKKLSVADKAREGMIPVQDVAARAEVCAGCHVGKPADATTGAPARDLYHDLLGAGHPRLNFEFSSYFAHLPRHWKEPERAPGHAAREWAVGQVVAARAALALLAERAANPQRPWPEFAEYDCAACHHDLREPARWTPGGPGRQPLGALPMNDWHFALLPVVLDNTPPPEIAELRTLLARRYPDREQVARQARAADKQLGRSAWLLSERGFDVPVIRQFLARLADRGVTSATGSWDNADQTMLALFALTEAEQRTRLRQAKLSAAEQQQQVDAALQNLLDRLTRPRGPQGQHAPRRDADFRNDLNALLKPFRD